MIYFIDYDCCSGKFVDMWIYIDDWCVVVEFDWLNFELFLFD